jgi:hypothetical protein
MPASIFSYKYLLIILILLAFVGNMAVAYGWLPGVLPDAVIALIIVLLLVDAVFLSKVRGKKLKLPGLTFIALFLIVGCLSQIYNGTPLLNFIVFSGYLFQFYLLFIALINLGLTQDQMRSINRVILFLSVAQLPIGLIKYAVFGGDAFLTGGSRTFGLEVASGTFGRAGGSMGTIFPLIAIGFMLVFYILTKRHIFIVFAISFVLFSFITGKRAFPILLIPYVICVLLLCQILLKPKLITAKVYVLVVLLGCGGLVIGAKLHPSLNPSQQIWGDFSIQFLIDKAIGYEQEVDYKGRAIGRYSATQRIFNYMEEKGVSTILVGMGPGTFLKSGLVESTFREGFQRIGIGYGFTGFVWLFVQVGAIGVICYSILFLFFVRKIIKVCKSLPHSYEKHFCVGVLGMVIVMVYDFVGYSLSSLMGKAIPCLFFLFLAQVYLYSRRMNVKNHRQIASTDEGYMQ